MMGRQPVQRQRFPSKPAAIAAAITCGDESSLTLCPLHFPPFRPRLAAAAALAAAVAATTMPGVQNPHWLAKCLATASASAMRTQQQQQQQQQPQPLSLQVLSKRCNEARPVTENNSKT
jgi:hypothetical protein